MGLFFRVCDRVGGTYRRNVIPVSVVISFGLDISSHDSFSFGHCPSHLDRILITHQGTDTLPNLRTIDQGRSVFELLEVVSTLTDRQAKPIQWWKDELAKNPRMEKDKSKVAFDLVEVHFGF
jgi:hypothetical protein